MTPENKRKAVDILAKVFGEEGQKKGIVRQREQILPEFGDEIPPEITDN